MADTLKLMAVLAHPDDESLGNGGILAKYAAEGVETYLVTATRGERGWFGFANLTQCLQTWIVAFIAEPTAFAPRCGDEVRLDSFGGVLCKDATVAERLIIRMCQHTHQFQFVRHLLCSIY